MTYDDKVFKAIERLLSEQIVSVVSEANRYCYKTCNGAIGAVSISFINDRVLSKLY